MKGLLYYIVCLHHSYIQNLPTEILNRLCCSSTLVEENDFVSLTYTAPDGYTCFKVLPVCTSSPSRTRTLLFTQQTKWKSQLWIFSKLLKIDFFFLSNPAISSLISSSVAQRPVMAKYHYLRSLRQSRYSTSKHLPLYLYEAEAMRMRKTKLFTRATREYTHTAPATKPSRIHLACDKPNLARVTRMTSKTTRRS